MVELVPVRIDRHLAADEASSIQGLNKPHTQPAIITPSKLTFLVTVV